MKNLVVNIGKFIRLPLYFLIFIVLSFLLIIYGAFCSSVPFFQFRYRTIAPYSISLEEIFRANLNTVDVDALLAVPGIGQKKAEAIIEYRETVGLFRSIDELENIKGISAKSIEKWREYLYVE